MGETVKEVRISKEGLNKQSELKSNIQKGFVEYGFIGISDKLYGLRERGFRGVKIDIGVSNAKGMFRIYPNIGKRRMVDSWNVRVEYTYLGGQRGEVKGFKSYPIILMGGKFKVDGLVKCIIKDVEEEIKSRNRG